MSRNLIIIAIYVILNSLIKGIQDTILFHFDISIFKNKKFLNPLHSWKNKYQKDVNNNLIKTNKKHWWYLFVKYKEPYNEKFPFSTSILVSFTDLWHFLELIRNILPIIIFSILTTWYLIFFYLIFIILFHFLFTYILKK